MALLWGGSWPAGRTLAHSIEPLAGSAWRFTFATLLLLGWMLWRLRAWPRLSGRQWRVLALGGLVGVAGYGLFYMYAMQRVEASRAAVVVTTNPVFVTLFAAWLFGEKFNARIALGLAFAVVGAATVLTRGAPWQILTGSVGLGEWLLIGCIATWAAYTLIGRGLYGDMDAIAATALSALVGTALLWGVALAIEGPAVAVSSLTQLSVPGWVSMIFLVVGSTVLAYGWYFAGVAALGAGTAASYVSLVPVFGVLSSALVLGESLDGSLVAGGLMALAGVVIANRARR